jgi:hypothetical protein
MEPLGIIRDRKILYTHIQGDQQWANELPTHNWIVFTIADDFDRGLINEAVERCLDNSVCYICCAGRLSSLMDDIFDEKIVDRAIRHEDSTGEPYDYAFSPMTTFHHNFSEGFWYAATVACEGTKDNATVVCIKSLIDRSPRPILLWIFD